MSVVLYRDNENECSTRYFPHLVLPEKYCEKEVAVKITETTDESVLLVECINCLS